MAHRGEKQGAQELQQIYSNSHQHRSNTDYRCPLLGTTEHFHSNSLNNSKPRQS